MATPADLTRLKRIAPAGEFTDAEMMTLIDAKGINGAAVDLWSAQVSATASLVDITESGSSRKNSQAHDKAKQMLEYYSGLVSAEAPVTGPVARTRLMRR